MMHILNAPQQVQENSFFTTMYGGPYWKAECSCGLFGTGRTKEAAVEQLRKNHGNKRYAPLLKMTLNNIDRFLNEIDTYCVANS